MGVASGDVTSVQMTASSYSKPKWPHMGRLNNYMSWCADEEDTQPYLQVMSLYLVY